MTDPSPRGAGTEPLGELALNVLLALGKEPLHGYGIIRDIEDRTGGTTTVRSGTLYATLRSLHDDGLVETAPTPDGVDGRRRYYRITPRGEEAVATEAARLAGLVNRAVELRLASRDLTPDTPS